jgi:uncharacterized surface protein with fasciclin (FAS1) repeats
MIHWLKAALTVSAVGFLAACGGSDDHPAATTGPSQNIVQLAQAQNLTALTAAATKAGLVDTLSNANAKLTVFAPTDAAFNTLATQLGFANATALVNALPASALSNILTYHVLGTEKRAADLSAGGPTQATLYSFGGSATTLALNTASGVKITDSALTTATVTTADARASNGVVHIVDKVLIPPGVLNAVQTAQVNPAAFSSLVAAVTKAGLASTLSAPTSSLTVFAPTNAAFNTLATRLGFADANALVTALPGTALANILTYHVLGTQKTAADLTAGGPTQATLYSFEGSATTLALNFSSGVKITDAILTDATVTSANVRTSNAVIHVIDKVLVPPGVLNIVQIAQANPSFSTLVGAVSSANLVTTLSGAGPFTVFAPTNDAFAAIASTVAGLTPAQLSTVLTYHVLGSQVLSTQIPFGTAVATVSGQTLTINNSPLSITDKTATPAPITATDIRASNGVIHVVSKVLIPTL